MTTSKNLINGKPLEFGNWEQIRAVRKLEDQYIGRKPITSVQEEYTTEPAEWGADTEDDEGMDVLEYQYVRFDCIKPNCQYSFFNRAHLKYFPENHTICCEWCDARYQIRDSEVFHVPQP